MPTGGEGNMEAKRVAAGEGWQWLVCGWRLFVRNPGIMVLYLVLWLVISVGANLVPIVGGLAMALIAPVLLAGWYEAAHRLAQGGTIEIGTLFEGFRRGDRTGALVALGALLLVGQLLLILIIMAFIGSAVMGLQDVMRHMDSLETMPDVALSGGMLFGMLLVVTGGALLLMAFLYAVPLVWFDGVRPVDSLKHSFSACLRNFLPLLILSLVYLVLVPLAMLPFGLGILVLAPVTLCTMYCSYRSVYGDSGAHSTGSLVATE